MPISDGSFFLPFALSLLFHIFSRPSLPVAAPPFSPSFFLSYLTPFTRTCNIIVWVLPYSDGSSQPAFTFTKSRLAIKTPER